MFVNKAHPAAHIEICVGGCNALEGPKDKQDVELFIAGAPIWQTQLCAIQRFELRVFVHQNTVV
jgi:hypothetical protein